MVTKAYAHLSDEQYAEKKIEDDAEEVRRADEHERGRKARDRQVGDRVSVNGHNGTITAFSDDGYIATVRLDYHGSTKQRESQLREPLEDDDDE